MCKELYWFQNCSWTKQFVLDMKWFKTENTISLSFSWIENNAWQKIKLKKKSEKYSQLHPIAKFY